MGLALGRVVVPAGTFHTGPVHLRSGVNLYVSKGAVLRFSTDPRDYLPVVLTSGYSNVLAENAHRGFELIQKPYSVESLSRILRKAMSAKASATAR